MQRHYNFRDCDKKMTLIHLILSATRKDMGSRFEMISKSTVTLWFQLMTRPTTCVVEFPPSQKRLKQLKITLQTVNDMRDYGKHFFAFL